MAELKVNKDLENKTLSMEWEVRAPKEKVWQAYADKAQFEKWWGPEGWETTAKEFDFRPGGKVHYGMKCVDQAQGEWFGKESWGLMILESVEAPNKFVAADYFSDESGKLNGEMPTQKFVVELVENGEKTRMVIKSITQTAEQIEELLKMGQVEGFSSQLNKLEKLLS